MPLSSLLSRFRTPVLQNTGSTARDHLASERTFLAWIRTGLGFIALGIAVERFSQLDIDALLDSLRPSEVNTSQELQKLKRQQHEKREARKDREQLLVASLLGSGAGSIIYGTTRYFSNLRLIEMGYFKPAFHGVGVLSVVIAGVAGASYYSTVDNERRKQRRT